MTGAALTESTLIDPAHSHDQVDDHPDVPTHVSRDDAFTTLHEGDNRHGGVGIYAPTNSSAPLYIGTYHSKSLGHCLLSRFQIRIAFRIPFKIKPRCVNLGPGSLCSHSC